MGFECAVENKETLGDKRVYGIWLPLRYGTHAPTDFNFSIAFISSIWTLNESLRPFFNSVINHREERFHFPQESVQELKSQVTFIDIPLE